MPTATTTTRHLPVWMITVLGVLAVLLAVVAVMYFVQPAHELPSFFPGHTPHGQKARTKHGIAAAVVAALVVAVAWYGSTRKRTA